MAKKKFHNWNESEPCFYEIKPLEYVTIGNSGSGVDTEFTVVELPSEVNDGDSGGIYFNREFAEEKKNYDDKFDERNPEKYEQRYG